ncbi:MAG: hypothetical protein UU48_C0013G0016 [Candidatus Uhrbacteria bacterium GW2011_GWF2_41_16]|jgi:chaperonin cofactor prefoldin|uniref:Uncharacterized protein n=2 Tax=Candidatus Uhriibacteriota TaxID=1752732 RepID=A0A0G0VD06_9BACT|nr:MAG: hypothetical protein UU35_C0012G0015 [Candidatus Uhrbacteria bacterium GW2011_GWC2_41_11]KKR97526.1 MAG: hypothetical protein UU48_C0013G0016 [Candidatus Uhrbacteria bacterium GW2011_GWF2_41_16]HBP00027.1 hypothetical protein [Candidatus Uhrbacteria bacterium]
MSELSQEDFTKNLEAVAYRLEQKMSDLLYPMQKQLQDMEYKLQNLETQIRGTDTKMEYLKNDLYNLQQTAREIKERVNR